MVNHACNLRCTYCYTGAKFNRPMPFQIGARAIERAVNSLMPEGELELGFFGGEPLIEAESILGWMDYARPLTRTQNKRVNFSLTTNGTLTGRQAWAVMLAEDLDLAISFDGTPESHDRHRRDASDNGSADRVLQCMRQLREAGKPFRAVMVVRPDNLSDVAAGLTFLHDLGASQVDLSLDLWTRWTAGDGVRLQTMIAEAAGIWRTWLPEGGVNWFDLKLADLCQLPKTKATARCGFGDGEIAIAPSGRLYPCERLIGEDLPGNPARLPGQVLDGDDFCHFEAAAFSSCAPCAKCSLQFACDTFCRCSNYVRTGDVNRPDGLLCLLNKAAVRAVAGALEGMKPDEFFKSRNKPATKTCYAC